MENLDLQKILRIARRRVWIWLSILCVCLTATVGVAYFLPNVYRASAFILVEGQQIPKEYVRSTVTTDIQNRLHALSQRILSRSRLEELINEYDLYPRLRAEGYFQEVIAEMRKDIGIRVSNSPRGGGKSSVAFEVSYTGTDPRTVTLVANRLASFYIDENLKLRAQQAVGTKDFLSDQVAGVKKQLEAQEQRIGSFKQKHLGALPGQLEANLKTLERLQAQVQLGSDNLVRTRERRDFLLRDLDQYRRARDNDLRVQGFQVLGGAPTPIDDLDRQVLELRRTLARLRSRFSDGHPDVIRTREELEALENERGTQTEAPGTGESGVPPEPYMTQVESQLRAIDAEIRFLQRDLQESREEIAVYQRRIEETPRREQELSALTRDYESTQQLYSSLLKRREEADLATSMEQRQKAERFRIIDPAILPGLPDGPKRGLILLMGGLLSVGLGVGAVLLREVLSDSFDSVEELEKVTAVPILVSIPKIRTRVDKRRKAAKAVLASVLLLCSVAGTAAASYYVARHNETLVKRFTDSAGGQQIR